MHQRSSSVGERGGVKRNRAGDILDAGGSLLLSTREQLREVFGSHSNDRRTAAQISSNKNKKSRPTRRGMNDADARGRQRQEDRKPRQDLDPTMQSRRRARRGGRNRGRRRDAPSKQRTSRDDANGPVIRRGEQPTDGAGPDGDAPEARVDKTKEERAVALAAEDVLVRHIVSKVGKDYEFVDLPRDRINDLPDVPYRRTKNAVVVVSNSDESDKAVADIRAELSTSAHRRSREDGIVDDDDDDGDDTMKSYHYVGLDTETRPKFTRGGENHPPALLQIATESTAYLFRLTFRRGGGGTDQQRRRRRHDEDDERNNAMTSSLMQLLSDTSIIKVGIGIHNDVRELERVYGIGTCGHSASYLDLGKLVGLRWPNIRRAGLRNLAATVLGYRLSKAQQMKDWEMSRLTPAMVAYAAADAFVALDLLAAIVG